MSAVGCVGINVAGEARLLETQRGNDAITRSLIDGNGCLVKGDDEIVRHFTCTSPSYSGEMGH